MGSWTGIVTADAMSCQKEIVRKIREGKADYVISLKGNHPALLEDISLYFEHFSGELPHLCDQGEGSRQEREAELSSADRTVLAAAANRMGRSASCRHGNCSDQQK